MSSSLVPLVSPKPTVGAALGRGAMALGRVAARMLTALSNRHQVSRLLELDDRALKDIGLVRTEVLGALETRLSADPSVLLRSFAAERRTGVRARVADARPVSGRGERQ